jgi:hypothetical protein
VPQATAVLTRTIGSGKDYASFTLAEADVQNIGASADLVFENERIVFEADAGIYSHPTVFVSTLTTDATRNVSYRAASGAEHGGSSSSGVRLQNSSGYGPVFDDNYMTMEDVVFLPFSGATTAYGPVVRSGIGNIFRNCICDWRGNSRDGFAIKGGSLASPTVVENCVFIGDSNFSYRRSLLVTTEAVPGSVHAKARNCTIVNEIGLGTVVRPGLASDTVTVEFVNCLSIGPNAYSASGSGTATVTGSNCFGDATDPWPAGLQGTPATITTSTAADPGAGDYALYVGKNGALLDSPNNDVIGQGVGPAANSDVPLYDILGNFRAGDTANPGAFEIPQATYTWKKTIGPVGRDYATFSLAEADVTNIPTSADLVNENEAIVFEADAGTYNESVIYESTLTTDATRQVTYRPAAGSEHGGELGAGVRITSPSTTASARDEHLSLDGLVLITTGGAYLSIQEADGVIFRNLLMQGTVCVLSWQNGATAPMLVENCVAHSSSGNPYYSFASSAETHVKYRNCTAFLGGTARGWTAFGSATYHLYVDIINCISINTNSNLTFAQNTDVTVTGSNNFGGLSSPFPVAIQGSPYPITATTDTDPGPGDWAIYDAATGALINDSDNDVLAGGVGPSANSDVPETDIVGNLRSGSTADPGAFEISSIPAPLPGLSSDMQQTYQAEAAYTLALTPSGVTNVTHQQDGASDYLEITTSVRSQEVAFPEGAQAVRVVATQNSRPCIVTVVLDDGAGGEVEYNIGYVGGAALSADYTHLWNLSALQSDGTYPKLKFTSDFASDSQRIYVWWHTS